jgi:transposase
VVIPNRNVNARTYRDLLDETLIPRARHICNNNFVYAHDNAPAHRARLVHDLLAQQEVNQLNWPVISPDMNPIEHIMRSYKYRNK